MLASASDDKTLRLWDVAGARPVSPPLTGDNSGVFEGTFSPNGKLLATGGYDQTIRLWTIGLLRSLPQRACEIANRNLTLEEWRQYLGVLPYHKTCANMP
jgi:WD40 repeat protein